MLYKQKWREKGGDFCAVLGDVSDVAPQVMNTGSSGEGDRSSLTLKKGPFQA